MKNKPIPPEKPLPSDCCGGGCVPCVLDVFEEEQLAYEQALKKWQESQKSNLVDSMIPKEEKTGKTKSKKQY